MDKRYFLFYFAVPTDNGSLLIECDGFPKVTLMSRDVAKQAECTPEEVVIMGWNEFKSKEDFDSFKGG